MKKIPDEKITIDSSEGSERVREKCNRYLHDRGTLWRKMPWFSQIGHGFVGVKIQTRKIRVVHWK